MVFAWLLDAMEFLDGPSMIEVSEAGSPMQSGLESYLRETNRLVDDSPLDRSSLLGVLPAVLNPI